MNLQALPLAALLNTTWVLTFAISLRYCQAAILVSRQYDYVHMLEESISPILRGSQRHRTEETIIAPLLHEDIYHREGKVYLRGYPMLLNVAWIAYVYIFPVIVILASGGLIAWEWRRLPYPILNRAFDSVMAFTLVFFLLLYWVIPSSVQRWTMKKERKSEEKRKRLADQTVSDSA